MDFLSLYLNKEEKGKETVENIKEAEQAQRKKME